MRIFPFMEQSFEIKMHIKAFILQEVFICISFLDFLALGFFWSLTTLIFPYTSYYKVIKEIRKGNINQGHFPKYVYYIFPSN